VSAIRPNCSPSSSAVGISVHTSRLCRSSEGEWFLPGVSTYVDNVLRGCSVAEVSIKRCAADLLASAGSEAADASWWRGLEVNRDRLFVGLILSASCHLRVCSPSCVSGSTSIPVSIPPTRRATFLWGSGPPSKPYGSSASCITTRLRLPRLFTGVLDALFKSVSYSSCLLDLKTRVPK